MRALAQNGFELTGTQGTAAYLRVNDINVVGLENETIYREIKEGLFGLVINISISNKIRRQEKTNGYYIRRLCIDYGISLIINIKCAKLYVESLVSSRFYQSALQIGESDFQVSDRINVNSEENNESDSESLGSDIDEIESFKKNSEVRRKLVGRVMQPKTSLDLQSVIDVSQFTRNNLRSLFKNASILKQNLKKSGKLDLLQGKIVGLYFDEPSSRTYGSFYAAVKKLEVMCYHYREIIALLKRVKHYMIL